MLFDNVDTTTLHLYAAVTVSFIPLIMEPVSEDAGEVEAVRVVKDGQIEKPVLISISGGV